MSVVISVSSAPVPILMYHEIAPPSQTSSRLAVSPEAFSAQLAHLHDEGYQTVTAFELANVLASGTGDLPERPVVLTFDDGFADFHSEAMERLDRYGFTATLFVTTGWVRDAKGGSDRRAPGCMLSWGQIEEAVSAGIEVAAHSHLHPELDQLPPELMRDDLATGKAVLEDTLGIPANGLAYPFGYFDARVRDVAEELGHRYSCAVANTMMDSESDLLALPRLTVRRSTTMPVFRQLVRGDNLSRIFIKDRALTVGWSLVRRSRAALGRRPRHQ
jgi:peptidoglycan/xylan/chitin deacetylase (PgdA/CDA1 family)